MREAVKAAKIATVGQRDAQIAYRPSIGVCENGRHDKSESMMAMIRWQLVSTKPGEFEGTPNVRFDRRKAHPLPGYVKLVTMKC